MPVIHGFVDDYAFMVRACLDVYESVHDDCWLEWAVALQNAQDALFWDEQDSAYFTTTPDDPSVILRLKEGHFTAIFPLNSMTLKTWKRRQCHPKKSRKVEICVSCNIK